MQKIKALQFKKKLLLCPLIGEEYFHGCLYKVRSTSCTCDTPVADQLFP